MLLMKAVTRLSALKLLSVLPFSTHPLPCLRISQYLLMKAAPEYRHRHSETKFHNTFSVLLVLNLLLQIALARPPPDPVQCNSAGCTIASCYGVWPDRLPCTAARVIYPKTEVEIVSAVAGAVRSGQKIKVVSRWAHSIPKLICPGGNEGLVISTRDYNRNLIIDQHAMTVTADSGVELRQLIETIGEAGLALPYAPYFEGVSLGGLLSTGAHGSSFYQKGSAVHEYVTAMTLVVPASKTEGFARVINLTETMEEMNAAKVSLGVLGVISTVTLKLEHMFKRSITNKAQADTDLEEQVPRFALAHEFGDITWHPSQSKAVYKIDDRVAQNASGNGLNDFVGFRPRDVVVVEAIRALETSFERTNDGEGKCIAAKAQVATLLAIGTGLQNNGDRFTGYPVVGFQNRLQASGSCLYIRDDDPIHVCPWTIGANGEFFHQTTVSIAMAKIKNFIQDVKALRELEPTSLCGVDLYYGFYMRFVKASSAYMGEQDDVVSIDMTYYRARRGDSPRLNEDVLEEIEQIAVFKYGGRPHWGKNRHTAFQGVWKKYSKLEQFLRLKREFDPEGIFSSEWSDAILGINPGPLEVKTDHCALEGLCICSEDRHCAPEASYLCKPGRVYNEARVCRHTTTSRFNEQLPFP